jgi:uncharacterized membrane protein (UPF0182 family)
VIPVESSFLYIVPVYLSSTTAGTEIPEIKRIIAAIGDNVAMAPTLNDAISAAIGQPIPAAQQMGASATGVGPARPGGALTGATPLGPGPAAAPVTGDVRKLVDQAVEQYSRAQAAQRQGDWATYGREIDALKQTLRDLQTRAK